MQLRNLKVKNKKKTWIKKKFKFKNFNSKSLIKNFNFIYKINNLIEFYLTWKKINWKM